MTYAPDNVWDLCKGGLLRDLGLYGAVVELGLVVDVGGGVRRDSNRDVDIVYFVVEVGLCGPQGDALLRHLSWLVGREGAGLTYIWKRKLIPTTNRGNRLSRKTFESLITLFAFVSRWMFK